MWTTAYEDKDVAVMLSDELPNECRVFVQYGDRRQKDEFYSGKITFLEMLWRGFEGIRDKAQRHS